MHCFVFLSLLSHYSTAVFTRVPFFDRKAKGVKGLGPFSDLCPAAAIASYKKNKESIEKKLTFRFIP